jgi:hypothetical protein
MASKMTETFRNEPLNIKGTMVEPRKPNTFRQKIEDLEILKKYQE